MERLVAEANIAFFMELLAGLHGELETDERRIVERLLAEEQARLAWLERTLEGPPGCYPIRWDA